MGQNILSVHFEATGYKFVSLDLDSQFNKCVQIQFEGNTQVFLKKPIFLHIFVQNINVLISVIKI